MSLSSSRAVVSYDISTPQNGSYNSSTDQVSISSTYYALPSGGSTTATAIYGNRDINWSSAGLTQGSSGSGTYTDLFHVQTSSGVENGFNSSNKYDTSNG